MRGSVSILFTLFFFSSVVAFANPSKAYDGASLCYQNTKANPSFKSDPKAWKACIQRFEAVHEKHKGTAEGTKALYSSARLRRELYLMTRDTTEINAAIQTYNRVIKEYPTSSFADDALYQIALLRHDPLKEDDRAVKAVEALLQKYPTSDLTPKAKTFLAALHTQVPVTTPLATPSVITPPVASTAKPTKFQESNVGPTATSGVETKRDPLREPKAARFGSKQAMLMDLKKELSSDQAVIVFAFDQPVAFTLDYEPYGKRTKSPAQLTLHVANTKKTAQLSDRFAFDSPFVRTLKMKKHLLQGGMSFTFVLGTGAKHDVQVHGNELSVSFLGSSTKASSQKRMVQPLSPQKQRQLRIVIDPGHGGDDSGALGPRGAKEKEVVLLIAKKLARELQQTLRAEVFLTRDSDRTLSLEERNHLAEKKNADLFLSIHANASTSDKVSGFQTYYLNNATDEAAKRLATRENASGGKPLPEVERVLLTMLQNDTTEESRDLAETIQRATVGRLGQQYPGLKDLRVHGALFYVLVGAKCPSVLIETSFISNPLEERRLRNPTYQDHMAKGITAGVQKYLKTQQLHAKTL